MNSSATECYTKINGNYQPINAIPAGIKCSSCQQILHPDQLESHLLTHINPSFYKPSTSMRKPGFKLTDLDENSIRGGLTGE